MEKEEESHKALSQTGSSSHVSADRHLVVGVRGVTGTVRQNRHMAQEVLIHVLNRIGQHGAGQDRLVQLIQLQTDTQNLLQEERGATGADNTNTGSQSTAESTLLRY